MVEERALTSMVEERAAFSVVGERAPASVSTPLVRLLLVVSALLLTGCGGQAPRATPASTPQPSASSSPSCPTLVLGFRGQGQSPRGHDGFGREAGQVARALAQQLPDPVRLVPVDFAARSGDGAAYDEDVAAAVRSAGRAVRSSCRDVVLVGYSQGAEVGHRVAAAHPGRVALAVLMGDPLRDPSDPVATYTLGNGVLHGRGNAGPGPRFPAGVRPHVLEVCLEGDDVCNAPLTGRVGPPSSVHRSGYQDTRTAQRITNRALRLAAGS